MTIEYPLLDLRVLTKPVIVLDNSGSAAAGFVHATTYLVTSVYLEGPQDAARQIPGIGFGFAASRMMVGYLSVWSVRKLRDLERHRLCCGSRIKPEMAQARHQHALLQLTL
jgi:hypothetical protein